MSLARKMTDLPTFLAYSVVMEEEAAERHDELADVMEVHNNPDVAATFRKLAHYSRLHAQEIREQSTDLELPKIAPWDFEWEGGEPAASPIPTSTRAIASWTKLRARPQATVMALQTASPMAMIHHSAPSARAATSEARERDWARWRGIMAGSSGRRKVPSG